jgi:dTMP kinase
MLEEGSLARPSLPADVFARTCLFDYNASRHSGEGCAAYPAPSASPSPRRDTRDLTLSSFITFEGPEGCGKTTQLRLLADYLQERGYTVLQTREPGGTLIGDRIRAILLDAAHTEMQPSCEFLLFSASRAQLVEQVIRPHLTRGDIVLCDRYADSSLAYQGYGHQLDSQAAGSSGRSLEALRVITRFATGDLVPDLTLYLDVPVDVGLQRKAGGQSGDWNRIEDKEIDYHQRVRAGYLAMIAREPERWVMVDATREVEAVQATIRERVVACLQEVEGRKE